MQQLLQVMQLFKTFGGNEDDDYDDDFMTILTPLRKTSIDDYEIDEDQ